jgi:hypothetical protein
VPAYGWPTQCGSLEFSTQLYMSLFCLGRFEQLVQITTRPNRSRTAATTLPDLFFTGHPSDPSMSFDEHT